MASRSGWNADRDCALDLQKAAQQGVAAETTNAVHVVTRFAARGPAGRGR